MAQQRPLNARYWTVFSAYTTIHTIDAYSYESEADARKQVALLNGYSNVFATIHETQEHFHGQLGYGLDGRR